MQVKHLSSIPISHIGGGISGEFEELSEFDESDIDIVESISVVDIDVIVFGIVGFKTIDEFVESNIVVVDNLSEFVESDIAIVDIISEFVNLILMK